MSITIGRFTAEGPFTNTDGLREQAGVYVILTRNGNAQNWNVVDVGESHALRSRVENHDRSDCWNRNNQGTLAVAAIYDSTLISGNRFGVEQELRTQFAPDCGER